MKTLRNYSLHTLLLLGITALFAGCASSEGGPIQFLIRETRPYIMAGEPATEQAREESATAAEPNPLGERL